MQYFADNLVLFSDANVKATDLHSPKKKARYFVLGVNAFIPSKQSSQQHHITLVSKRIARARSATRNSRLSDHGKQVLTGNRCSDV